MPSEGCVDIRCRLMLAEADLAYSQVALAEEIDRFLAGLVGRFRRFWR